MSEKVRVAMHQVRMPNLDLRAVDANSRHFGEYVDQIIHLDMLEAVRGKHLADRLVFQRPTRSFDVANNVDVARLHYVDTDKSRLLEVTAANIDLL
jgi:hypothetical protein